MKKAFCIVYMKKCLLAFVFLLVMVAGFSQVKPTKKEKPPTAKEMEEMQKELDKAMKEMSPEDKRMMDSMGIKMPSMPTMPKMTDKQIATAFEEESRIVPVKDVARIGRISKQPLTNTAIPTYLNTVHADIITKLDPYVNESGEKIYQWVKKEYQSATATGNAAVGFWMMGKPEIAIYIMSKACMDDPADADNLNNFSALLTMAGAEQHAIPLLENLNRRYPKNTTILNNIGQAWFGLGEIGMAEKYLDSCIRIYTSHSQANMTKSLIDESKGDKQHAVEALKRSIKEGYSMEKENRLNKFGYKLKGDDLGWDKPMPQDPLGLEKFNWPEYPFTVVASEGLEKEWRAFIDECQLEISELTAMQSRLEQEMMTATQKRMQQVLQAGQQGVMIDPLPRFAPKAVIKLKYLVDGKDGKLDFDYQKRGEALAQSRISVAGFEDKYEKELQLVKDKYEELFGEGKPNPFAAACADENKVKDAFLKEANGLILSENKAFLEFMRRMYNDRMYYCQYTMWPEEFELAKVQTKISWLNLIKDQGVKFLNKSDWCRYDSVAAPQKTKLGQFEDMHCNYHSELKLGVGTINSDCSKLTAKLDLYLLKNTLGIEVVKLKWTTKEGDRDDESFIDQFQSARVELGAKKGVGYGQGPFRAEAKAGAAGFVEIDRHGISDAGIILTAEAKLASNFIKPTEGTKQIADNSLGPVKDPSLSLIGAETKISIQSGFTAEGKGILKGMKYGK